MPHLVVREVLEDSISTTRAQLPAAPDTLRGDSPYSLPSVGSGNGAIGSGADGGPDCPRLAVGGSSGADGFLGLFSFGVGGGASDASRAPGATAIATATATSCAGVCASRYA